MDFILHGGDVTDDNVISDLETIAPTFGVHGNNDDWNVLEKWPATRFLTSEKCNIGLVHGHLAKGRAKPLEIAGQPRNCGQCACPIFWMKTASQQPIASFSVIRTGP